VDTTIRNLDEDAYRRLRARAVLSGQTTGALVSEAIRSYLARPQPGETSSLADLVPEDYGKGQERLSEEIDAVVYGVSVSA
jgi:plasmid stability protein